MPAETKGGKHILEVLHQKQGATFASRSGLGLGWLGLSKMK